MASQTVILEVRDEKNCGISKIVFADPVKPLGCNSFSHYLEPCVDAACNISSGQHSVMISYEDIDHLIQALKKAKLIWGPK